MTEFWKGASDFITANWGQVVAILTSSGFALALIRFFLNLILTKVKAKSTTKSNAELVAELKVAYCKFEEYVKATREMFEELKPELKENCKEAYREITEQYNKEKQKIFEKVMTEATENEKEAVDNAETIEISLENSENIENNAEILAEEEKVEEVIKEEENNENNNEIEEGYVVVEKSYKGV